MGFPSSDFRSRVPGVGPRVPFSDMGLRVWGLRLRVSCFGFRACDFGFRVSGSGCRVSGNGVRVSGAIQRCGGCDGGAKTKSPSTRLQGGIRQSRPDAAAPVRARFVDEWGLQVAHEALARRGEGGAVTGPLVARARDVVDEVPRPRLRVVHLGRSTYQGPAPAVLSPSGDRPRNFCCLSRSPLLALSLLLSLPSAPTVFVVHAHALDLRSAHTLHVLNVRSTCKDHHTGFLRTSIL